jgi:hypothetical protein
VTEKHRPLCWQKDAGRDRGQIAARPWVTTDGCQWAIVGAHQSLGKRHINLAQDGVQLGGHFCVAME